MFTRWSSLALLLATACCKREAAPIRPIDYDHVRYMNEKTVAIYMPEGDHPICAGTWVSHNRILTAQHCTVVGPLAYATQEEQTSIGQAPTAYHSMALVKVDEIHDLALFESNEQVPTHLVADVSRLAPETVDTVEFIGHRTGWIWFHRVGRVVDYIGPIGLNTAPVRGPWMHVEMAIAPGDSGGALYNLDGEIVGVCSRQQADAHNVAYFVTHDTIVSFLR